MGSSITVKLRPSTCRTDIVRHDRSFHAFQQWYAQSPLNESVGRIGNHQMC